MGMKNNLKKYLRVFIISILVINSSCQKDDKEAEPSPQELIIGEWTISQFDPDITINGINLNNIPPEILGLSEDENQLLSLLLSPNSSSLLSEVIFSFDADGSIRLTSESISITDINYTLINENQLMVRWDDEKEINIDITELSAQNMEIKTSQQFLFDLSGNEVEEVIEGNIKISLRKFD